MADSPELYYVVGPSGAGKTTLTGVLPRENHVNHDDLMRQYNNGSSENITAAVRAKADAEENRFWNDHLHDKQSFSTEKTLKYTSVLDWVEEAKQAGFRTHVAFIAAGDAQNHVDRVQTRIGQGGHSVPPKEIRDIHKASMSNLELLVEAAGNGTIDRLTIYDNQQHTGLAVVNIENGEVRIERDAPDWLRAALEHTPFNIENLQLADKNRLTIADLDKGSTIRAEAMQRTLEQPAILEYMDVLLSPEAIQADLNTIRVALLHNKDTGELVRDIKESHGYTSDWREYADSLVISVENALAKELTDLEATCQPINPTLQRSRDLLFWQEKTPDYDIKNASGPLMVPGTNLESRDTAQQRAVSQGKGDHAGHLIGHQFGGPEIPANLSLQHYGQNQGGGTYYNLEKDWADKLKQGTAIQVQIREMTKAGEERPYHRHVDWTETTPDGKERSQSVDFVMTESERARAAQGIVLPVLNGTTVELYPDGPPPPEDIAVALTPAQVRALIQAELPNDIQAQRQAYSDVFNGDEPVTVLDQRVELGYSPDQAAFYGLVQPDQKQTLDDRLTDLSKQPPAKTRDFDRER